MITSIIDSEKFQRFLGELEEKMLAGLEEHGESKHDLVGLAREIKDECLDMAGWGFLAWRKADKLLEKVIEFEEENSKK